LRSLAVILLLFRRSERALIHRTCLFASIRGWKKSMKSVDQNSVQSADNNAWRDFEWSPEMVVLPAGCFAMGENENDKFANDTERPRHFVTISDNIAIGKFPVTVAEFRAFDGRMQQTDAGDLPVVNVSWKQMTIVSGCLEKPGRSYRLPSEAAWEYACRGGTDWPFYRGDQLSPAEANYLYDENGQKIGRGKLTPYGCYPLNGFGIADLLGNVCGWMADYWHPNYNNAPSDGSPWVDSGEPAKRVIRGGAWDYLPRLLRCAWRDWLWQTARRDNVGFRVAVTL
jgi:formylglycine-generating enzyme required for sulfatase activity